MSTLLTTSLCTSVRCKLRLHFKPKPRKGGLPKKKFTPNKLQFAEMNANFEAYSPSLKTVTSQGTLRIKHSGINWRVLSCRHLKRFWGFPPRRTKTDSTRTTKWFRNWWRRSDHTTKPILLSRRVLWGGLLSVSFAVSSCASFERSIISSRQVSQRGFSNMQT